MSRQLFIMDSLDSIDVSADTSSLLILEGLSRGHEIFIAKISDLVLTPQFLKVKSQKVKNVDLNKGYDLAEETDEFADEFDVIWLRKDPPFDETYLAHLSLFDHLTDDAVLFVNDPRKVRELNEKLTIFNFPDFIVDTIVTMNVDELREFFDQHGKIVVKSLTGFSGNEVELITDWEKDFVKIESLNEKGKRFVMAQRFIDNVYLGDKRVYLLNGEVLGQLLRVPTDSFKGNLHAGGRADATELNQKELEIAIEVGEFLKEHGIIFAGIDLIDGYLTEVNVTSPGVLVETNKVSNKHLERKIWDCVEAHIKAR